MPDIYIVPVDGGEARRITRDPAYEVFPSWSPDGEELVYGRASSGGEGMYLYTIPVSGGEARRLEIVPHRSGWGRWSPDGRWFAYQTPEGASTHGNLWLVSAQGGTPIAISTRDSLGGWTPSWSPDGARIAFTAGIEDRSHIAVVPLAGGEVTVVANNVAWWSGPSWSPDGETIAYSNADVRIMTVPAAGGEPQILPVSLEGGRDLDPQEYMWGGNPCWSPDGKRIVFESRQKEEGRSRWQLWTVPATGGAAEPLTLGPGDQFLASWSPDGESIAFTEYQEPVDDIWIVDAWGGRPLKLTDDASRNLYPFWLPGGKEIGFLSNRFHNGERLNDILAVHVDGGTPRLFYSRKVEPGNLWSPALSPDGRYLAYRSRYEDPLVVSSIYIVSLEDGTPEKLVARGRQPAFSPDGERLAFIQPSESRTAIWVADVSRIVGASPQL